jgi:hypothetical protein
LLACPVVTFAAQELILTGVISYNYVTAVFGLEPLQREAMTSPRRQDIGLALSFFAGLLFAFAVPREATRWGTASHLASKGAAPCKLSTIRRLLSALSLVASIALCCLILSCYKSLGESPLIRNLWFASIALFVFALGCVGVFSRSSPEELGIPHRSIPSALLLPCILSIPPFFKQILLNQQ